MARGNPLRRCRAIAATSLALAATAWVPLHGVLAVEPPPSLLLGGDLSLADPAVALPQIVNLARLDPDLAASMIPDGWIDDGIEGAQRVAHEEPRRHPGTLASPTWPIGPWNSARDVETSIRTLDPTAAAALYDALEPRIAARCRTRGASFARCEQEFRMSLERLSARAIADRAAGREAVALTDTQLEFARMGPRVVAAGRAKLEAVARAVWP